MNQIKNSSTHHLSWHLFPNGKMIMIIIKDRSFLYCRLFGVAFVLFFFILVARFSFSCCWWWFGIQVIWHPWNFFHWQTNKTKQNKNDDDNDDIIPSEIGYFLSLFLQRSMLVHCVVGKRLHAHTHIYRLFADLNIFFGFGFVVTRTQTHTHTHDILDIQANNGILNFLSFFCFFLFIHSFLRFVSLI